MTKKNRSQARLEAIKILLNESLISDQQTLVELLYNKFNIETNQSVLSRDLRKLGIIKQEINKNLFYRLPEFNVTHELLKLAVLDIKYNEVMIVVKTYPGLAAFVGDYIDQQPEIDILGCLAGENVVFIACNSVKKIEETYALICQKLHLTRL